MIRLDTRRDWRVVGVAVPLTVAAAVLAVGCRGGSDEAGTANRPPAPAAGSGAGAPTSVEHPAYVAVEDALRAPGNLAVCGRRQEPGGSSGSYERRTFALAVDGCPPDPGSRADGAVVVDAYDSAAIRDSSSGIDFDDRLAAWTYLEFVVSVTEGSAPEVVSGVEVAMASLGAQKTYDERPSPTGGG